MGYARLTGFALLAWGMFAAARPCHAQATQTTLRDDVELTRADIQSKRREILQKLMEFTPEESQGFWPVYREYQTEAAKVGDQRVAMIENYLANSSTMTEKQAEDLLKDSFKFRENQLALQKKYVGRFRKVLPAAPRLPRGSSNFIEPLNRDGASRVCAPSRRRCHRGGRM